MGSEDRWTCQCGCCTTYCGRHCDDCGKSQYKWVCSCKSYNERNYQLTDRCKGCKEDIEKCIMEEKEYKLLKSESKLYFWTCFSCRNHNISFTEICHKCFVTKSESHIREDTKKKLEIDLRKDVEDKFRESLRRQYVNEIDYHLNIISMILNIENRSIYKRDIDTLKKDGEVIIGSIKFWIHKDILTIKPKVKGKIFAKFEINLTETNRNKIYNLLESRISN